MTISPPAKVKKPDNCQTRVLASNIDTLVLAIYIQWKDDIFFQELTAKKQEAVNSKKQNPIKIKPLIGTEDWKCYIQMHGAKGFEWILNGCEFNLRIGNWLDPIDRPSVMAEIRSEALWRLGAQNVVNRIEDILYGQGAMVLSIKPSRADICADIILLEAIFSNDLIDYAVTRADHIGFYTNKRILTGISIGRGNISARLYDKPLEIVQQSKKYWMYDIWGIQENDIPDGYKIIRVEFQLRREVIVELGIDTFEELFNNIDSLWAYCTQNWLKFQDRPGKHHTMRKTLYWWEIVQKRTSTHDSAPLIRSNAMNMDDDKLFKQAYGFITSREANLAELFGIDEGLSPKLDITIDSFKQYAESMGLGGAHFADQVIEKRTKFQRSVEKRMQVHMQRKKLGQPSNIDIGRLPLHQRDLLEEKKDGKIPDNAGIK